VIGQKGFAKYCRISILALQYSNPSILVILVLNSIHTRLKTVERAQLNFRHRFWSNIVQVGRNSTHGWYFLRRFGRNLASFAVLPVLEKFRPTWTIFDKLMSGVELRAFDRFYTNFGQKKLLCKKFKKSYRLDLIFHLQLRAKVFEQTQLRP
jgi:hypothetical protein